MENKIKLLTIYLLFFIYFFLHCEYFGRDETISFSFFFLFNADNAIVHPI